MRAGKYSFQDLFVNRYVEQIVIPEIQRDYVWQKTQVEGILFSIAADFKRFQNAEIPVIDSGVDNFELKQLNSDFADFYRQRNHSSNIGFIYAYSDQQYEGRYFLIDGQQRITTLYLVLLLLAARTGQASDFEKNYCANGLPKLDYRVRESARSFIRQLVPYILKNSNTDIEDQSWYLNSYKNDITVKNILNNIDVIEDWLEEIKIDEAQFYLYLNNYTEFWYFDTNISAQGENLYIYLNARGEQVQGNENLKAELLSRLSSIKKKNEMGCEWENWQDFFWRMRRKGLTNSKIKGLNADKGFNEFLRCIAGLNIYLEETDSNWVDKHKSVIPSSAMLSQVLNLDMISRYIEVLTYVESKKTVLEALYPNSKWVEQFLHDFWSVLNTNSTAWVIDYSYDRLSTERRRMVLLWGVLHWVDSAINAEKEVSVPHVFRGIRQFYLRYKNNVRSVVGNNSIKQSVSNLLETGFISLDDDGGEEYQKERWIAGIATQDDWADLESLLWEIEGHPYNIDGSDVGLTNSSHLVDFKELITVEKLTDIKNTFYMCFPPAQSKENTELPFIQSLLLHYGQFWRRKSPYYYENYQFNDWRNIIRSRIPNLPKNTFNIFFDDLIALGGTVEELLALQRKAYVHKYDGSLRSQLLWYNNELYEKMWNEGSYIALCEYYTENDDDLIFHVSRPFLNTKGDFKGGNPRELFRLLPEDKRTY
jgi:hypothetical protein